MGIFRRLMSGSSGISVGRDIGIEHIGIHRTARLRRRNCMNKITFLLWQRMKRRDVVDLQDALQLLQQSLSPLMNCEVPR